VTSRAVERHQSPLQSVETDPARDPLNLHSPTELAPVRRHERHAETCVQVHVLRSDALKILAARRICQPDSLTPSITCSRTYKARAERAATIGRPSGACDVGQRRAGAEGVCAMSWRAPERLSSSEKQQIMARDSNRSHTFRDSTCGPLPAMRGCSTKCCTVGGGQPLGSPQPMRQ